VEELAALMFTIEEIALFTHLDEEDLRGRLLTNPFDELTEAYNRGKLKTKIKLRFDSLNYALHGSPEAVKEMREHMTNQQINENA